MLNRQCILFKHALCSCEVLTLASNERIPLNPTMRLVFEISHLCTATPATVSRAGSRHPPFFGFPDNIVVFYTYFFAASQS